MLSGLSHGETILFFSFSFFLIPLSFYPKIFDPGLSLRFCLLAALIAAMATIRLIRSIVFQQAILGCSRIFALWCAGFCFACIVSYIPAINKSESIVETAKVFLFISFIWFASTIVQRFLSRIRVFANSITVSALIFSLLGILEYWGKAILLDNEDVGPGATMLNKNLLSSYLFLCLGFTLFSAFSMQRRLWRFLGFIGYASILYIFLATQSRAVWLGCVGGLLFAVILTASIKFSLLRSLFRAQKKKIAVCALIPCIMIVIVSLWKPANSNKPTLAKKAATIVDAGFNSNRERILLWQKSLLMFRDRPFLGVGTGNWKIICPKYGTGDFVHPDMKAIQLRPCNDFLWVLTETGPLGFFLYCGLFVLAGLFCVRFLRSTSDLKTFFFAFLLLFTLSGFAIISFFDFPKERIEHLVLFGFILSLCASINSTPSKLFQLTMKNNTLLTGALLLCAMICLWIGIARLKGDINDAAMRAFWMNREWQQAIFAADRASSAVYTMEPTSTPLRWYRGVANFKLGNIEQAFIDYQCAYHFHPWHLNVLNDFGTCLSLKGDQKRAVKYYSDALSIFPFFEPALINLAAIYFNIGKYDSAYSIISKVKSPHSDPRFESFYRTISQKTVKGRLQ
jgi:O-antigen ligase